MLPNQDIRNKAYTNGVRMWEIAEKLGISDMTLTRRLRKDLSPETKKQLMAIIDEIITNRKNG